jgi:hypothetical protein
MDFIQHRIYLALGFLQQFSNTCDKRCVVALVRFGHERRSHPSNLAGERVVGLCHRLLCAAAILLELVELTEPLRHLLLLPPLSLCQLRFLRNPRPWNVLEALNFVAVNFHAPPRARAHARPDLDHDILVKVTLVVKRYLIGSRRGIGSGWLNFDFQASFADEKLKVAVPGIWRKRGIENGGRRHCEQEGLVCLRDQLSRAAEVD